MKENGTYLYINSKCGTIAEMYIFHYYMLAALVVLFGSKAGINILSLNLFICLIYTLELGWQKTVWEKHSMLM